MPPRSDRRLRPGRASGRRRPPSGGSGRRRYRQYLHPRTLPGVWLNRSHRGLLPVGSCSCRGRLARSTLASKGSVMPNTRKLSRRLFLAGATGSVAVTLLAACSGPQPPAASTGSAPTAAPAAASTTRKQLLFWGRAQFLPESNDYLTESVKLAGQKGNFDVSVQLFS